MRSIFINKIEYLDLVLLLPCSDMLDVYADEITQHEDDMVDWRQVAMLTLSIWVTCSSSYCRYLLAYVLAVSNSSYPTSSGIRRTTTKLNHLSL